MGVISVTDTNKNIECVDLEAHVVLAQHRYRVLEERIARAEAEVAKVNEKSNANKKIIFGSIITIATGSILGIITAWLKGMV